MKVASPLINHELAEGDETQVNLMRMAKKLRDSLKDEPKIRTSISPAQMILRVASSKYSIVYSFTCNSETSPF